MSSSSLQTAIYTNELRSETLEGQITDNSMTLRLVQKYTSCDIDNIRKKYGTEKDAIEAEINTLDKIEQQDEYQDLMAELKELRDEEEDVISRMEEKLNDQETAIQFENETLEVQKEEIDTQTESFKEMLKQNIENEFGYFQ